MNTPNPHLKPFTYLFDELSAFRRDLHIHPELAFAETRTSEKIASYLQGIGGITVHRPIGKTGLVGELRVGQSTRTIALRADIDALPIDEQTNTAHRSQSPGKMHGCGHDGHTAMLLGAAKHLARTKQFDGTVYFIFQPAEETGDGARAMLADGLFDRFKIDAIYAIHNSPNLDEGCVSVHSGPMHASQDDFQIRITGRSGHAAQPHKGNDVVVVASEVVMLLQTIVSRRLNPLSSAVISVTQLHAGTANNVLPTEAVLQGTIRTHGAQTRTICKEELERVVAGIAAANDVEASITFTAGDPPTINTELESAAALAAIRKVIPADKVLTYNRPIMASEDFGYYQQQKPGCYFSIGNGLDHGVNHSANYDFNDNILLSGVACWVQLVEDVLVAG